MKPPDLIAALAKDGTTLPDIRELLSHIHDFLGGTAEYAEMVAEDVKAATKGSNQRLGFHNNYITNIAKFGGNEDLAEADPEALNAEAELLMARMQKAGHVTD